MAVLTDSITNRIHHLKPEGIPSMEFSCGYRPGIDCTDWLICNKLIILAYIVLRLVDNQPTGAAWIILFLLSYIAINMAYYLIKHSWVKQGLLLVLIILIAGCARFLYLPLALLLPVNLFELVFRYSRQPWLLLVVGAIPALFLPKTVCYDYIPVCALSYIIFLLSRQSARRLQVLMAENDDLRDKIHSLSGKLIKNQEYERQLKYFSQLEERNKIAQEIHDKIGHTISGGLIQLEAARMLIATDREQTKAIIQKVIEVLREGMESLRATLKNIKPAARRLGVNRIRLLLDEFGFNHHLKTSLLTQGNLERISQLQWKILYDNINEALTNALKYAQATTITVNIEVLNKLIKAEVKDNGIGAYYLKKGLGIGGMEERSGNIGGKIIIDGSRGFSVITLLPMEGE